jgi:hypothetical protein
MQLLVARSVGPDYLPLVGALFVCVCVPGLLETLPLVGALFVCVCVPGSSKRHLLALNDDFSSSSVRNDRRPPVQSHPDLRVGLPDGT